MARNEINIDNVMTALRQHGGAGSGHFGHRGRPGKRGGSLPGKGEGAPRDIRWGVGGSKDNFEVVSGEARAVGMINADFPNDKSSSTRGEIWYIEVPKGERRQGKGYALAKRILSVLRSQGMKTVNLDGTTKEGRALVEKLIQEGDIGELIRTSKYGKAEYRLNSLKQHGGAGSGHHGHRGRPGKRGGSLPGKGGGRSLTYKASLKGYNEAKELERVNIDHPFYGKETIGGWLERHDDVERTSDGLYKFYHATPKKGSFSGTLREGTLLETDEKSARHYAARDRDLDPVKDIDVITLYLRPSDIDAGVWASLRREIIIYSLKQHGGAGSGHFDHRGRPGKVGGSLPSGAAGIYKKIKGPMAPKYKEEIAKAVSIINKRFPELSHINVVTSTNIGGSLSEFSGFDSEIKVSEYLLQKEGRFEKANRSRGNYFSVQTLTGTIYHEYGHGAIYSFEVYGRRSDFLGEISALKQEMPLPSEYAKKSLSEWACEQFALEQSKDGDGPVTQLIKKYYDDLATTNSLKLHGGPGSGHHGHRGRPGKVGGSLPGKGGRGQNIERTKSIFGESILVDRDVLQGDPEDWENAHFVGGYGELEEVVPQSKTRFSRESRNRPTMWRSMSAYELSKILETGEIQSTGAMTFHDQRGMTFYGDHPSSMYATDNFKKKVVDLIRKKHPEFPTPKLGDVAYSIEVRKPPGVRWNSQHEFYTTTPMSASNIVRVIEWRPAIYNETNSSFGWFGVRDVTDEIIPKITKKRNRLFDVLKQHGGKGSGHHGHRGRPGKVGGSLPAGYAATYKKKYKRDKYWGPKFEKLGKLADELGIPMGVLKLEAELGDHVAGYQVMGRYLKDKDQIIIYANAFSDTSSMTAEGILVHEWTHRVIHKAHYMDFFDTFVEVGKKHGYDLSEENHWRKLFAEKDGVTAYSTEIWNHHLGKFVLGRWEKQPDIYSTLNETFCEISRLKQRGEYESVDPVWRDAYEAFMKKAGVSMKQHGGKGSGHFDHKGRPGKVGGSLPSKGGGKGKWYEPDRWRQQGILDSIAKKLNYKGVIEYHKSPSDLPELNIPAHTGAAWDPRNKKIYVFEGAFKSGESLEGIITHELTHEILNKVDSRVYRAIGERLFGDNWVGDLMGASLTDNMTEYSKAVWLRYILGDSSDMNAIKESLSEIARMKVDSVAIPDEWDKYYNEVMASIEHIQKLPKRKMGLPPDLRKILEDAKKELQLKKHGGPGSGHFGHEGRPGKVGGSKPGMTATDYIKEVLDLDSTMRNPLSRNMIAFISDAGEVAANVDLRPYFKKREGLEVVQFDIFVPMSNRRKGYGTQTVNKLKALADEHGIVITGTAKPFGQGKRMSQRQLIAWYRKLGFSIDGDKIYYMPKKAKTNSQLIDVLKQHGGPGSGHHGHKGRPGKVGGSLPSGASGRLEGAEWNALTEEEQISIRHKEIHEMAREVGIPEGKFEILEMSFVDQLQYGEMLIARYDKTNDMVQLFDHYIHEEDFNVKSILSHENTHRILDLVLDSHGPEVMNAIMDDLAAEYDNGGWASSTQFYADMDGVTQYSWHIWNQVLDGNAPYVLGIHETLCEVARLRSLGPEEAYRQGGRVENVWNRLFDRYMNLHKSPWKQPRLFSRVKRIINTLKQHGGKGSGHFDHKGRPGKVGGSLPSGAAGGTQKKKWRRLTDDLRSMDDWLKEHNETIAPMTIDVMSADDYEALRKYKHHSSYYEPINHFLREGKIKENDYWRTGFESQEELEKTIEHIDKALSLGRMPENTVVFRGAKSSNFPKGVEEFTDRGFVSTSLRLDEAGWWAKVKGDIDNSAIIEIRVPEGYPALALDLYWEQYDEKEILLPRGTTYKVISDEMKTFEDYSAGSVFRGRPVRYIIVEVLYDRPKTNTKERQKERLLSSLEVRVGRGRHRDYQKERKERKENKIISILKTHGGPGSGHYGHRGRPGKVGGSLPSKGKSDKAPALLDIPEKFGTLSDLQTVKYVLHPADIMTLEEVGEDDWGGYVEWLLAPNGKLWRAPNGHEEASQEILNQMGWEKAGDFLSAKATLREKHGFITFAITGGEFAHKRAGEYVMFIVSKKIDKPTLKKLQKLYDKGIIPAGITTVSWSDEEGGYIKEEFWDFMMANYVVGEGFNVMLNKKKALKIHGGPGSGHHGHKGRPGKVGGSLPSGAEGYTGELSETSRKLFDSIAQVDQKIKVLRRFAKKLGIPEGKLYFPEGASGDNPVTRGKMAAAYYPETDEILVFRATLRHYGLEELKGVLAHEATHRDVRKLGWDGLEAIFFEVSEKHGINPLTIHREFEKRDGVTPYSKKIWEARVPSFRKYNETYAELARLKQIPWADEKYGEVDPLWRDAYEIFLRKAKAMKTKTNAEKRKGDLFGGPKQTEDIVIYLGPGFTPVESKEDAVMAKVLPVDGVPYFVTVDGKDKGKSQKMEQISNILRQHGGKGSGHFDHRGRPGKVGGSLPSGAGAGAKKKKESRTGTPENDTYTQYRNPDGTWTPERQAKHDEIVAHFFKGKSPVKNPTSYIMGGGTAAGKSTITREGLVSIPDNHVLANSDDIKALLPEYGKGEGAPIVHEESSYLAKLIANKAAKEGYNVLLDGTGDSQLESLRKKIKLLSPNGQPVIGYYVSCPLEVAIKRNILRAQKSGRYVPEIVVRMSHVGVSQVFKDAVEAGLFTEARLYDSTSKQYIHVMSAQGSKITIHDEAAWQRFLAKGQEL